MNRWKEALLAKTDQISKAIGIIEIKTAPGEKLLLPNRIALVVDENGYLLGVITDGDIRKALLQGNTLATPVSQIMNTKFCFAREGSSRDEILEIMRKRGLGQMPVLDVYGKVVGLELLEDFKIPTIENWVILMAGGLGSRLGDLTRECPKPLLEICGKPVIEIILTNFIDFGFKNFFIIVNYLGEKIIDRIGDGSKWGVKIVYLREQQRLGTAGGLSLLPEKPEKPMIVMNGDVLTKLSILHLLDFHQNNSAFATMCVREYDLKVPFGVARVEDSRLLKVDEKPIQRFFVNAGIYVLAPEALDFMSKNTFTDMPDLFNQLISIGKKVTAFPIIEYWIDIGRLEDLAKAKNDFSEVFSCSRGNTHT